MALKKHNKFIIQFSIVIAISVFSFFLTISYVLGACEWGDSCSNPGDTCIDTNGCWCNLHCNGRMCCYGEQDEQHTCGSDYKWDAGTCVGSCPSTSYCHCGAQYSLACQLVGDGNCCFDNSGPCSANECCNGDDYCHTRYSSDYKCNTTNCCCERECSCTSWEDGECGGGSCAYNQRQQTRHCDPSGCSSETRCINDPSCATPPTCSLSASSTNVYTGDTVTFSGYVSDNEAVCQGSTTNVPSASWSGSGNYPWKSGCRWFTGGSCSWTHCPCSARSSSCSGCGWNGSELTCYYYTKVSLSGSKTYGPGDVGSHTYYIRGTDNSGSTCEKKVTVNVQQGCIPHDSYKCYDNDVYWYDSCGAREDKKQECGTSGWTNEYRCSGRNKQRKWINRGCSGSSCYANAEWKNVQDCGTTSYGSWSYYCSNNDKWRKRTVYNRGCSESGGAHCYYYTSTQNEFVQDCGSITCGAWSSWYCDGNIRTRKRTCSGGYCESGTCKSGTYTEYDTQNCGSDYWTDEYRCSGNTRQRKYVHRGCSDGSCYNWAEWKDVEDCEFTSYGPWSNYCSSDDVWKKRTITHGFCSGGSCTTNTSTQTELVTDCGDSSWADPAEYQCSGSWKQRKWINRGCSESGGAHCYETPEWKNVQNCAETCSPGALAEGCEGGTYSCVDGECTYPITQCIPRQFTSSGTACKCNEGRKTILKACNGAGACLDVEEVCDVQCGADPACQGKKPGDAYPGKPGRICCEGKWGLPKWREIVPW